MTDEEPPVPEEILTSATEQLDEEEISLADNEEILHALSELTPVYENERSYFVLCLVARPIIGPFSLSLSSFREIDG